MKNPVIYIRKILLWTLSLCITLAVLAGMLLIGSGFWLRSNSGQAFIKTQITHALEKTPYHVEYGRAVLRGGLGLNVDKLTVSDEQGIFLILENTRITINPALLPAHILSASILADRIELLRTPKEPEAADKQPRKAFDPSGLWLKSVSLNRFAVNRFDIGPALGGGKPLSFSPDLKASVKFEKTALPVTLKGRIESRATDTITPYLPAHIDIDSSITPAFDLLTLTAFSVTHDQYTLKGSGAFGMSEEGLCAGQASLDIKSLAALFKTQDGTLHLDLACSGPALRPALKAEGVAAFKDMPDMTPVNFKLQTAPMQGSLSGQASISGAYKQQPYALATPFLLENGKISVSDLKGTFPETSVAGHLIYNFDTSMADGTITASIASLTPYAKLLKQDMAGRANITLTASPGSTQKAALELNASNLRYQDIRIAGLTLNGTTDNVKTTPFQHADIAVKGITIKDITITSAAATIRPAEKNTYNFDLSGNGTYQSKTLKIKSDGTLNLDDQFRFSGVNIKPLILNIQGHDLTLNGSLTTLQADLRLKTENFPVSALMPAPQPEADRLTVDGTLDITGPSATPQANLQLTALRKGSEKTMPDLRIDLTGAYQNDSLTINAGGKGQGIKSLNAQAKTYMHFSLWPFAFAMPMDKAVQGDVNATLSLTDLSPYFIPPGMSLSGNVNAKAAIGGTLSAPDIKGAASLADGVFTQAENGLGLKEITMNAGFEKQRITLTSLSARDNAAGALNGNGWIEPFGPAPRADINLNIRHFQIIKNTMADVLASAGLKIQPDGKGFVINGSIDIEKAAINIPEKFGSQIPELNVIDKRDLKKQQNAKPPLPIRLAIALKAVNQVFVRGWGLDAEFGGAVDVGGTLDMPDLQGRFDVLRGRFQQFGKIFKLDKASLLFQGAMPPGPYLDVSASTTAEDVTASINITGPAKQPKLSFSSEPALPEDEVLSRILFGRDARSISPFQAIQLANTLRQFSGKGGGASFDPVGKIRKITGVDELNVDTDDSGGVTVGAGKYITDRVYLEAVQGSNEKSGAIKVQTEITPSISVESKAGQEQSGAGLFWKRDY